MYIDCVIQIITVYMLFPELTNGTASVSSETLLPDSQGVD